MNETVQAWSRLVGWLEEHAPVNHRALNGPASEEEIAAAEEQLGVRLPDQLRAYLKVNNGTVAQLDDSNGLTGSCTEGEFLSGCWALLPLSTIVRLHHVMMPGPNEDAAHWDREWIPFAAEPYECGEMYGYFVDAITGSVGRWGDYGERDARAYPSLRDFFDDEFRHMCRLAHEGVHYEVKPLGEHAPDDPPGRVLNGSIEWD
ncbi:SMI1/KNR4 family protein [Streptomyces sp. NPDC058877]|uniref:SMI1/KNR4 family protein n=1 Tax=Streptomyces sp. NPDC058877 TaxID=3346665 RepID=UPI00369080A5